MCARRTRLPVTAKIRIGWDHRTINAVETARILEQSGIRRIAVHGRTKEQGYSGRADWSVIAEVAATVAVPVVGNGDITTAGDALERKRQTGVAGLMIGRAAMASPWIFTEIRAALETKVFVPAPSRKEKWELMRDHCAGEIVWRRDERMAMRAMRSRLMAYTRGLPGAPRLRDRLARVESLAELEDLAAHDLAHDVRTIEPAVVAS